MMLSLRSSPSESNPSRKKDRNAARAGKNGRRWYKDFGLGLKTPETAIDGTYIDKNTIFGPVNSKKAHLDNSVVISRSQWPFRGEIDKAAVQRFLQDPSIYYAASNADPASFAQEASQLAGNKHNSRPQLLMFILQDRNNITHGEIKRYCECKLGIPPQCVQYAHVQKAPAQYISNVLMKFNAKLGGFTNTVFGPVTSKKALLDNSVVIIGADVSHAAPGLNGPSMAAMTVSMNDNATRYAAAIEASGHSVETITDETIENIEKHIISPIENGWSTQAGQGKIPATVVYFRDLISESQFA
ncbi:Piwi-domain-containing protein [Aureobasidium pullulans]|nr:Piwi-domain-containing protein [Aureobasidium pullulans]